MSATESLIYSDMRFNDFDANSCYRIEDAPLYKGTLKHLGFKTVEFVLCLKGIDDGQLKMMFVEAKPVIRPKFDNEIRQISQKFIDALQIVCGIWHGGRKDEEALPPNFKEFMQNGKKIVFVLIVKNCDKSDLLPAQEAIYKKLQREHALWKFEVKVLNEELAKKENLVLEEEIIE